MPSKKPTIQVHTDKIIIEKMKVIAEKNSRSLAKEIEYMCKMHILKYEMEHGTIETKK